MSSLDMGVSSIMVTPSGSSRSFFDDFEKNIPLLAVITEPHACESDVRLEETFMALSQAVTTKKVHIISIRLSRRPTDDDDDDDDDLQKSEIYKRGLKLARNLMDLATSSSTTNDFRVVCSSDWIDLAMEAQVHGIHVKESHLDQIPSIRERILLQQRQQRHLVEEENQQQFLIGTSTHSIESAIESYTKFQPDYYFCGTCFLTTSHPEKTSEDDLEGPTLPGQVRQALKSIYDSQFMSKQKTNADDSLVEESLVQSSSSSSCLLPPSSLRRRPVVLAIGGIDETNCDIPIRHGADGVAVIRAVLQANDPANVVDEMYQTMIQAQGPQQEQQQ